MNPIVIILIILTVLMVIFEVYHSVQTKRISDTLVRLVTEKKFAELYKMLDEEKKRKYVPQFNLYYLGMNAGIIQNDSERVNSCFDELSKSKLNEVQTKTVYTRGLQYFITISDKDRCKICCEHLQKLKMDPDTKKYLDRIYDVMIMEKNDCLNDLLEEIEGKTSPEIFADEFLIAAIYRNIGDTEKEKEYQALAQSHMDQFLDQER